MTRQSGSSKDNNNLGGTDRVTDGQGSLGSEGKSNERADVEGKREPSGSDRLPENDGTQPIPDEDIDDGGVLCF